MNITMPGCMSRIAECCFDDVDRRGASSPRTHFTSTLSLTSIVVLFVHRTFLTFPFEGLCKLYRLLALFIAHHVWNQQSLLLVRETRGAHLKFISIQSSSTDHVHSIPPVVSKGYQAKGAYKTINGLKTCKLSPYQTYDTCYMSDRSQMLQVLSRPRRLSWSCTVSCYWP
jgi:hypothetical protein